MFLAKIPRLSLMILHRRTPSNAARNAQRESALGLNSERESGNPHDRCAITKNTNTMSTLFDPQFEAVRVAIVIDNLEREYLAYTAELRCRHYAAELRCRHSQDERLQPRPFPHLPLRLQKGSPVSSQHRGAVIHALCCHAAKPAGNRSSLSVLPGRMGLGVSMPNRAPVVVAARHCARGSFLRSA